MIARFEDIEAIARQFVEQGWSELRVIIGDTHILLSTDRDARPIGAAETFQSAPSPVRQQSADSAPAATITISTNEPVDPAWIAVTAPNLGTFYRSPKPGSAPFVEIGETVTAQTEICLIEVMKLFTSVTAGAAGIVRQVCAADAELVEAGRILFYLEQA